MLHQTGSISDAQYSLGRVRLRRVRFTGRNLKMGARVGLNWVHIGGGILWPWDGSELPFGLFPNGSGGASSGGTEG